MATITRNEDGTLPAYAWPGGYPLFYLTVDAGHLCPDCANGKNASEASTDTDDPQWRLIDVDVYWEGPPILCDHCNDPINSAYGDPENPDD